MSNQNFPWNPTNNMQWWQAINTNNAWAYFQTNQNPRQQQNVNPNTQRNPNFEPVQNIWVNQVQNFSNVQNPNIQRPMNVHPQGNIQQPNINQQQFRAPVQGNMQVNFGNVQQPSQQQYYNQNYWMPMMQQQMYNQNRQVVKPAIKKWSNVSMKWFLIGCSIFLLFIIWGWSLFMYYLINNPDQLANMWLDRLTTKKLLQAFSWVFFWLLFLLWFGMTIVNSYRTITVKNKPKLWYALGILLWLVVFIASIWFGYSVITKISAIQVDENISNNQFVVPYMNFKWIAKDWISDPTVKFIAPSNVSYYFNAKLFNSQIYPTLGQVNLNEVTLDCGNWQKIPLNIKNWTFDWSCIYFKKGTYPLKLEVYYSNIQTNENLQNTFDAWSANFESEISIKPHSQAITYNDAKTEMIMWKAPSKVTFDASSIFKDFGLTDYKILWDANDDGKPDKQDSTTFTYTYKEAKLHYINIRFPDLNNYTYTFPIRVEQSDVPICEISWTIIQWTEYDLSANFLDNSTSITDYSYSILDRNLKVIDTQKSADGKLKYTFPGKWTYSARLLFLTNEWKKGECESDDIQVLASEYDVLYDIFYKSPQLPEFKKIQSDSWISLSWNSIIVSELPVVLQLNINKITPDSNVLERKLVVDGKTILSSNDKKFEFTVDENKDYNLILSVEDQKRWTKSEIPLKVLVRRQDIIWKMMVKPSNVGQDPFSVTLDASTTVLNDPKDEIVFFTRDFDDWEIQKNLSQWIVNHIYRYNTEKEIWDFNPKVTIKTKKQREITIWLTDPIIVKKTTDKIVITSDTHPSQVAKIWDNIALSLQIDWLPTSITWDFGDSKTFECKNRECVQMDHVFGEAWFFIIKATVKYDGKPDVSWTLKFKVQ